MKKTLFIGLTIIAGFAIRAGALAFNGTAIGSWSDPQLESKCADWSIANKDIGGVAKVKWGDPAYCDDRQSYLEYDGAGSDSTPTPPRWSSINDPFLLGTLKYFNGTQWENSGLEGIDLNVKVSILDPFIGSFSTFEFGMGINNTINPAGDTVLILSVPEPKGFSFAGKEYLFELLGFSLNGGQTMTNRIFAFEDQTKCGGFYGRIVDNTPSPTPVPDRTSMVTLLGLAAIGLAGVRTKLVPGQR